METMIRTAKRVQKIESAKSWNEEKLVVKRPKHLQLRLLFIDLLKNMHWAESAMLHALHKMSEHITSQNLLNFSEEHIGLTQNNIQGLVTIFESLNENISLQKCETMEELIIEADLLIAKTEKGNAYDAGAIVIYQKMQHYKISTYGSLEAMARVLEVDNVQMLLLENLKNDKKADALLTEFATGLYRMNIKFEDTAQALAS